MRFLRRPVPPRPAADLTTLRDQGEDMIGQLAEAHLTWGFGSARSWRLDQRSGTITWHFPDRTAIAPAQIIGGYDPATSSWLWAWANNSIPPALTVDSRRVREWAEANAQPSLTVPRIEADAAKAAGMGAIAVRVIGATGFFRGDGDGAEVVPFVTFGPVTVTTRAGATETFEIEVS